MIILGLSVNNRHGLDALGRGVGWGSEWWKPPKEFLIGITTFMNVSSFYMQISLDITFRIWYNILKEHVSKDIN